MANEYTLGGPPPQSRSEKILMKQNSGPSQSRIEELLKNASGRTSGALIYKGTVETAMSLPSSGNEAGDVYHVNSDGSEWSWNGEQWEELGKSSSVLYTEQTLTPAQQEQARLNIDAISMSDLIYATPEQFGAKGDGVTDDTAAVREALQNPIVVLRGDYLITDSIAATAQIVTGTGTIRGSYGLTFSDDVRLSGFNMVMGNHADVIAVTLSGNAIVDGISITGGRKGISHNSNYKTVVVTNSEFKNMWGDTARAIEVLFSYICRIENNFIENISNNLNREADGVHVWQIAGAPNAIAEIKYNVFHNCRGRFIKASTYNTTIEGNYCYNDTDFTVISDYCGIDVQKGNSLVRGNEVHAIQGINVSIRSTGDVDAHHVIVKNRLFRVETPGGLTKLRAMEVVDHAEEQNTALFYDASENYIDWGNQVSIQVPYVPNSKYIFKNNEVKNRTSSEAMTINTSSTFDSTCRFEIEGNTCGYAYFVTFRGTDKYPNCKGDYKVRCEKALTFSELKTNCSFIALITGSTLDGKFRNRSFVRTEGTDTYFTVFVMDEAHYGIYEKSGIERLYLPG